jgi:hypothetical protein
MKTLTKYSLLSGAVLLGATLLSGCGLNASPTPAYSEEERDAQIARNWTMQWQELADDTDNVLLLRPDSNLTGWDVYHRE